MPAVAGQPVSRRIAIPGLGPCAGTGDGRGRRRYIATSCLRANGYRFLGRPRSGSHRLLHPHQLSGRSDEPIIICRSNSPLDRTRRCRKPDRGVGYNNGNRLLRQSSGRAASVDNRRPRRRRDVYPHPITWGRGYRILRRSHARGCPQCRRAGLVSIFAPMILFQDLSLPLGSPLLLVLDNLRARHRGVAGGSPSSVLIRTAVLRILATSAKPLRFEA